ncbi:3-hydroxyacyl-ACP dehydratase FabZ family protein [Actinomadura roseirufa]|uniref:3-hydroxyacyl-ACP dehydratase FabZ family protein n=1 Tax=Actinomadura roseirufa TaxID=2094049 RepID=UPI00104148D3|nr:beta-hydroxyacyl-ACP dehydratase [Actinomadura roseirufa]
MTDATAPVTADGVLGFTEIKRWLRHRHPMIYIDRVLDHRPGEYLRSTLAVSGTMDSIAGHFPERAIFPGSHLIQAFAQSGIILYQMSTSLLGDDELTLIGSVHSKFHKIVVVGDQVVFDVRSDRITPTTFHFSCRATVEDRPVAAFRGSLVRVKVEQLGRQLW